MKPVYKLLCCLLLPVASFAQSINSPAVGSTEDHLISISKIEVTAKNTVVSFKYVIPKKGSWVELNKSMYLQDSNGDDRYSYIKSEGIPLKPEKHIAAADNEEVNFTVYFEKLKPGTKEIDIIERARPVNAVLSGATYFNFYNVSLEHSAQKTTSISSVTLMPPPEVTRDTAWSTSLSPSSPFGEGMASIAPMMGNMYQSMLDTQLKIYNNPKTIAELAKITRSYYDALIKTGFTDEQALKIVISKPLVSFDGK